MKVLYRYMLKSFIGPLALTLAIALFVLLMQFVWIYIDDLVGKGLSWYVITKLMVLVTFTLIPMALPLAILLASIMTFGNLAEHHELACMKASGLSLPKIMSPLIVLIFFISVGAFFFANNVLPWVNLKKDSLLYDVRSTKPALNIQQEVFYNGIDGYSIRIGKKDPDQQTIHNIMIYDHTSDIGNTKVILADWGKMKMSTDQRYLILDLYKGNAYQEMIDNTDPMQRATHPMLVNKFDQQTIYFDLSGFRFSRTNQELFMTNYQMLDLKQLKATADSMVIVLAKNKKQFADDLNKTYYDARVYGKRTLRPVTELSFAGKMGVLENAATNVRNAMTFVKVSSDDQSSTNEQILRRRIEWQRKFTFAFACFILFFIGAPFGAIIKKGGLGLPVVVSALFFIMFYIISIIGEKSAREEVMTVVTGMWMPAVVLFPIGVFLTYKASMDSSLFETEAYINLLHKIIRPARKSVKA